MGIREVWLTGVRAVEWLFGLATLLLLLSIVAAIPVLHFIALGYMLEVQGRIARSGRLAGGFPLVDLAPRVGSIVLGMWLWLFPLRLLAGIASDAHILHPGSGADVGLHRFLAFAAMMVTAHICVALAAGGRLSCFFRPFRNLRWIRDQTRQGSYWPRMEEGLRGFFGALALFHHFWLGLRGAVGAFLWLVVPTVLFAAADISEGPAVVVTLVGGGLLMLALSWVPFLQARFASEGRWGAFFELGAVRGLFGRAPIAWLVAIGVTLLPALPLYVFRIVLPPEDALWLITPAFVLGVFPGKVVTGWAYGRASHRERPAWLPFRWLGRLLLVPLLAAYVFPLFFTQFVGEHGKGVLFEHHAFMLRVGL